MAAMLGTDGAKKTCPKMNFEMGISCSRGTIWMRPTVIHQYISKSFFSMVCVVYNLDDERNKWILSTLTETDSSDTHR